MNDLIVSAPVSHALEWIDRVFVIVFSRFRREFGDSDLARAWRVASYRVTGHLVLPITGVVGFLVMSVLWFDGVVPLGKQGKSVIQIAIVLIGFAALIPIERRFKRFLSSPYPLTVKESRDEKMLVFRFRALGLAVFVLSLAIGVVWRELGSG